jgi:signal transduction histidine kinase
VIDSGTGIGAEDLEKIFDPFFTTKERGTGLGLSIVHSIVEGYGGKVTVQSRKGKGSVFSVYLPLAEASGNQSQSRERTPRPIPAGDSGQ